jgi:hypothetical protein
MAVVVVVHDYYYYQDDIDEHLKMSMIMNSLRLNELEFVE